MTMRWLLFVVLGTGTLLSGCSPEVKEYVRERDYRTVKRAEARANAKADEKMVASPIANVFDMDGYTTDLGDALAFARVNGRRTLVFLYRDGEAASDQAKSVLNSMHGDSYERVAIDVKANPGVARRYGVSEAPAVVVLSPSGSVAGRVSGGNISQSSVSGLLH